MLALLYAFTFFVANVAPALLVPRGAGAVLRSPAQWAPSILGTAVALLAGLGAHTSS